MERWGNTRATGEEAPANRYRVTVAPGVVQVSRTNVQKRDRSMDRASTSARFAADQVAVGLLHDEPLGEEEQQGGGGTRDVISEWSRKSRANMIKSLAQLDYEPLFSGGGVPAMLTLTLPGEWESVAPSAAAAAELMRKFRKRMERAWFSKDEKLCAVWKREFQRRGAPHWHLFMAIPQGTRPLVRWGQTEAAELTFPEWCSQTWA
ncbi:rolling circle replication-associated protein, partial [Thermomonospora catenispora]|uniref:rolling circle replication-associated protein n=1 Tax=Thermomonospora catenispora TaxID=2493090 RepID=UPI0019D63EDE